VNFIHIRCRPLLKARVALAALPADAGLASDVAVEEQTIPEELNVTAAENLTGSESMTATTEDEPEVEMAMWPVSLLASFGVLDCGYLTYTKLSGIKALCLATGASSCSKVLESPWASIGPVPLAAIGLLAYFGIFSLSLTKDADKNILWWLCFGMSLVSLVLMAVLTLKLHLPCTYCAASAFISACLLLVMETGKRRAERLESRRAVLAFSGLVALAALRGATIADAKVSVNIDTWNELTQRYKPEHPPVLSDSSEAETALARHLSTIGAACYTAWWCPHCQEQRENFGKQAVDIAPFVQCSTLSRRPIELCTEKDLDGYPTWIIGGKKFGGARELRSLAELSNFTEYPLEDLPIRDPKNFEYIWGPDDSEDSNQNS